MRRLIFQYPVLILVGLLTRPPPPPKVIDKVLEAYDNFKGGLALNDHGYFELISQTNDGMDIFMVINKSGEMITAYPTIK